MDHNNIPEAQPLDLIGEFIYSSSWLTVGSSNVEAWRWLPDEDNINFGTLEVEFKDGSIYQYYNVEYQTARDFYDVSSGGSPGRFVWNRLRDVYDYARVNGPSHQRTKPNVIRIRRDRPQPTLEGIPFQPRR